MPDYNETVALQARGYNPDDAVAPLRAFALAQQGKNLEADTTSRDLANQGNQLALLAKQGYVDSMKTPGADPVNALSAANMVYDPEGSKNVLANIGASRQLGAIQNYAKHPTDPTALAGAGPAAVGEAATAQSTQATTTQTQQQTASRRQEMIGSLAAGYLSGPQTEEAWDAAIDQAYNSGVYDDPISGRHNALLYAQTRKMPIEQRQAYAKQLAAAGVASAQTSGLAAGAKMAAEHPFDHFSVPVTDTSHMGSAWGPNGPPPPGGFANPAPTAGGGAPAPAPGFGRSVASDGTVPVAPAAPPRGQPTAGYDSAAASRAAQAGGWRDQATPAQMRQPPMMTQAEGAFGLPTGYLGRTAQIESGGRANASNPSGAAGMFQFMPGTWARYGDPGTSPLDPQAATVAAARLAADNSQQLTRALGRPPTGAELYLAHQQGASGAAGLLSNPNAPASSIVGAKAVIANGGTPNMTAGQFASMWERKFNGQGANSGNFSISGPNPMGPGVTMPTSPPPAVSLPGAGMVGLRAAAPQPHLAPPVPGPVDLTQPVPSPSPNPDAMGRSTLVKVPPQTAPLTSPNASITERGMTPFQFEKQKLDAVRAVDEEKGARDQFISANDAQRGLLQLQDDLAKLTPVDGASLRDTLLAPGTGADSRIGLAKSVNTMLSTAGLPPLFDQEKITAAESAAKTTGRLGFDLAGGLGKGEAASIVHQAVGLNPSVLSTPQGSKLLIGSLMATQQRQKDLYLYQGEYAKANGGNPIGAEAMFDENRPPMTYVQDAQRLARIPLPAVKYLQAHGHDQGVISDFNQHYGSSLARYYLGSRTD